LPVPGAEPIAFVDVPGHEKLVRTMVAGASGVDYALLLVAADDGVMPQTREHLSILSLLGLRQGLAVLTKADRVDEQLLAQRWARERQLQVLGAAHSRSRCVRCIEMSQRRSHVELSTGSSPLVGRLPLALRFIR
jgi:selenocysteine-specific translation elongation factor